MGLLLSESRLLDLNMSPEGGGVQWPEAAAVGAVGVCAVLESVPDGGHVAVERAEEEAAVARGRRPAQLRDVHHVRHQRHLRRRVRDQRH